MHEYKKAFMSLLLFLLIPMPFATQQSEAVAFCALRDPAGQIYSLYPDATAYRSVVSNINSEVRDRVSQELPFTLHNRELGEHTLYVALKDTAVLGFVHVRSEKSLWGLVEIVWALDQNLNVRDFRFQRCRDPGCKAVLNDEFKTYIQNKDIDALRLMLTAAQTNPNTLRVEEQHQKLAISVIQSALKTIVVTEQAWKFELDKLT